MDTNSAMAEFVSIEIFRISQKSLICYTDKYER